MAIGQFYGMVGALLWHPATDRYLILQRSAEKDFAAGEWECTTGRVDQGEGFTEAVRREVHEELGVEVEIDFILGTAHFYRGEALPENEIIGVMFCCSLDDPRAIRTSWEHSNQRWVTVQEAEDLLSRDHWLSRAIHRAGTLRQLMPDDLIAYYRREGFIA